MGRSIKKLDMNGTHCTILLDERQSLYESVVKEYNSNLKQYSVKLPPLSSIKGLWLIYLYKYKNYIVHKDTIATFVKTIFPTVGNDQQVRHLAADGWYILNRGEYIPGTEYKMEPGYHLLFDTRNPKPTFLHNTLKRVGRIGARNFEELKIVYNNRCATCGAEEGRHHPRFRDKVVVLQQGHIDPTAKLDLINTIPQCESCNSHYKDFFVFDVNGYITKINDPNYILKSDDRIQEEMYNILSRKLK